MKEAFPFHLQAQYSVSPLRQTSACLQSNPCMPAMHAPWYHAPPRSQPSFSGLEEEHIELCLTNHAGRVRESSYTFELLYEGVASNFCASVDTCLSVDPFRFSTGKTGSAQVFQLTGDSATLEACSQKCREEADVCKGIYLAVTKPNLILVCRALNDLGDLTIPKGEAS